MEDNKIGFLKRVFLSVTDFDSYQRFATEKTKVAVKYIITFMLVFCAIISIVVLYKFNTAFNSAKEYLEMEFPDFEIRDGRLYLSSDEEIILENEKATPQAIIIDVVPENYIKNIERLSLYQTGIGIFSDKIVINLNQNKVEYTYTNLQQILNIGNINRQELVQKLNEVNYIALNILLYVSIIISLLIFYTGWTLLDGLIMAALGYIMSKIYMIKIRFTSMINIALHALTFPLILNLIYIIVNMLTGFTIKYFDMIYTAITCVYVITAILIIRSNMIRKQIELQNILQEQKNKEDEIYREEDPDKKKEKEEKKDKENKEEDKPKENGEAEEGGLA